MTKYLLVTLYILPSAIFALARNISSAQECLSSISNLTVLTPSSSSYITASQPFNFRLTPSPCFITSPTSVPQIQSIVTCAANAKLSISAKSGGHSYAAYGLGGDVVIDLSNLKNLTVNADGTAIIQTGNKLGDVATGIFNQGQRALPHGSCPFVGSGGHTLYGGFGFFSRVGGLLLDTLVSAEVVLANGTLVTASNISNMELFWAIRGGGPSFGLVTSWTFQTLAAPSTAVHYVVSLGIIPTIQVISAYTIWQSFVAAAPNELASTVLLEKGNSSGNLFMSFSGFYYGSMTQFQSVIKPLVSELPDTARLTATALGWIAALEANAGDNGTLSTSHPDLSDTFFAKSLVTIRPLSNVSLTSWINYLAMVGSSSDTRWFAQADLWGGAISSVPAEATAFAHRDAFLVYQFYASSSNKLPPYPDDGILFLNNMMVAIEPNPQGAYPNYIDPTLTAEEWKAQYFGDNTKRLQQIKAAVDPNNVFRLTEGF